LHKVFHTFAAQNPAANRHQIWTLCNLYTAIDDEF